MYSRISSTLLALLLSLVLFCSATNAAKCTANEFQSVEDLYGAAIITDACSPYVSSSPVQLRISVPCSATDCVAVMRELAADLPDCLYKGANEKSELTEVISVCTDDNSNEVDSSASLATPAFITNCTTKEATDTLDLYMSTAESDECAADSTINPYGVIIFTTCDSDCAGKIKDLAKDLPNCYYRHHSENKNLYENKKRHMLFELEGCDENAKYISDTLYVPSSIESASTSASATSDEGTSTDTSDASDSSIESASTSASATSDKGTSTDTSDASDSSIGSASSSASATSDEDTSTATSDGSEAFSNGDPADTTLDSSSSGSVGSSTASPRVSSGMLQLWAVLTLLAGVFLAL